MKKTFDVSLEHFKEDKPDRVQRIEVELPDETGLVAATKDVVEHVDQAKVNFEFREAARRIFFQNNCIQFSNATMTIVEVE